MSDIVDHRWTGEIDAYAPAFEQLHPTGAYRAVLAEVPQDFEVATRSDYEAALRASGKLAAGASIGDDPELVAAAQAHWHASGANGCHFAMHLSENRERFGWETWVLSDRGDVTATAEAIAEKAGERLAPVDVDVLSFLVPQMEKLEELGELVESLGLREGWKLTKLEDPLDADLVLLGLTVALDLGHWSEILGFGPGAGLANTRRAPFTELAIRAKPPRKARPNHRAYMADVPLDSDSATIALWKRNTHRWRAERLGDEHDARGKAKVTTVYRPTGA